MLALTTVLVFAGTAAVSYTVISWVFTPTTRPPVIFGRRWWRLVRLILRERLTTRRGQE